MEVLLVFSLHFDARIESTIMDFANTTDGGTICNQIADSRFGPQIQNCRDNFDLTLKFEHVLLSLLPNATLFVFVIGRIFFLRKQAVKARHNIAHYLEQVRYKSHRN
jgi:hypothetical protein